MENKHDKQQSLERLASNYACKPSEVKQKVRIEFLQIPKIYEQKEVALNELRKEKFEEAKVYNIHRNNTACAIMLDWLNELFLEINQEKEREIRFMREGGITSLISQTKRLRVEIKGEKNPFGNDRPEKPLDFSNLDMDELHTWIRYERYNANFEEAIRLIDIGLNIFESGTDFTNLFMHFFRIMRSKSNVSLGKFEEALDDIRMAYSLLKKNDPYNLNLEQIYFCRILVLKELVKKGRKTI